VHIILINLDCESDPRNVYSCVLTALVTAMELLDSWLQTAAWLAHLMLTGAHIDALTSFMRSWPP